MIACLKSGKIGIELSENIDLIKIIFALIEWREILNVKNESFIYCLKLLQLQNKKFGKIGINRTHFPKKLVNYWMATLIYFYVQNSLYNVTYACMYPYTGLSYGVDDGQHGIRSQPRRGSGCLASMKHFIIKLISNNMHLVCCSHVF